MTYRLAALAATLWVGTVVAQSPTVHRASEPAAGDLDRLSLTVAWRLYLPVTDRSDGIASVQPVDDQVFVQLKSGRVICIQAEFNPKTFRKAGDVLWQYRPVGQIGVVRPLAVGPTEVYLAHGDQLLLLDRADGKVKYNEELQSTAAAAPIADARSVYLPLQNRRVVAYSHTVRIPGYRPPRPYEAPDPVVKMTLAPQPADALVTPQNRTPSVTAVETLRPPFKKAENQIDISPSLASAKTVNPPYRAYEGAQAPSVAALPSLRELYSAADKSSPTRIKYEWELLTGGNLDQAVVLTGDPAVPALDRLTTASGRTILTAYRDSPVTNSISTEYFATANVSAPLVAQGDLLYVASADNNLISLSMRELRQPSQAVNTLPIGKFTTGGPVEQKPLLTDDSLYVVGTRYGLIRLQRGTLLPLWTERLEDGRLRPKPNPEVVRVLAANSSFLYALDRQGKLLVIDVARGQTLSALPLSGFDFHVTNELTDRLYLASGNGLLLSLHDRRRRAPEFLQKAMAPAAPKKVEPVEEKKEPEAKEPPPKAEPPKAEPPKKEPPPKAEEPKKEPPPKAEEPKKEEPKKE
jgi:outer membrane protein assembly factor BamB